MGMTCAQTKLTGIKRFDPNALARESRSQQFGLIILSKQEVIRILADGP